MLKHNAFFHIEQQNKTLRDRLVFDMTHSSYSVLMSVYIKDNPAQLRQSIESILNQSVQTDDFVIVCDGPLTKELSDVLIRAKEESSAVCVYELKENQGLGKALAYGMAKSKHELVARMDADDISLPDRCEKQLKRFEEADVDVVGGLIAEFCEDPNSLKSVRVVPEHMEDILEFAKMRSPVNHVSVMYKKTTVLLAGGYEDLSYLEDYYLWIRMLEKGAIFSNIQEILVLVRAGRQMYARRSGLILCSSQIKLARYMRSVGFLTTGEFLKNLVIRVSGTLLPNSMRKMIYEFKLRDKA